MLYHQRVTLTLWQIPVRPLRQSLLVIKPWDRSNAASNFEISIGDTAALIADVMNVELEIITDQQRLRPEGSEVNRLYGDNTRLLQLTDWQPSFSGLDGFRRG